ncbi:class I SAM-dependent DNA methyltransferase [Shouchella lonarensis]|uniref:Uncharacterized methyltransferase SAMN05421737_11162 n=1 Tax=Shouchella lonarensis TaxID=1464122 RepID=A0A1G6N2E5_9BACI|nr:class I SAM-dependent methyltransferase [Shouchella lonarensis]SDC61305.1 putative AdoMet-dependent methyltransferase [Shouchella lonarensis]
MGREFDQLFDEWADTYDETVAGIQPEYRHVFDRYDEILQAVVDAVDGHVVEFGVGTGNLSLKLLEKGVRLTAVEPSKNMRKIAQEKLAPVLVHAGDFLYFSPPEATVDAIVSSYAFHHLTDEEKAQAARSYAALLQPGGKVVFADTMFASKQHHEEQIEDARARGYERLAEDLRTEYYPTVETMARIFSEAGFETSFTQMNTFVWVMTAEKLA